MVTVLHWYDWNGAPQDLGEAWSVRVGVEAAGLTYALLVPNGVTFHKIRHTAAPLLAELPG